MLILTLPITVGGCTGITLKEQQLADPLICIDAAVSPRAVAEFQREMTFPAGFRRCRVHNDAETRVRALTQTDHSDVGRNAQLFKGNPETV